MFIIKNKSDVDVYARGVYAYIAKRGKEYVEFIQNLLNKNRKDKVEEILRIIVSYIYDYFLSINTCEENKINENTYILDDAFILYAYSTLSKRLRNTNDVNLIYLIKSILLSIKDVNSNILYALRYNKNKDANIHIKYIIAKYTNAKIKITRNVARRLGIKVNRSISIDVFHMLYEKHIQNQIEKFESETSDEVITKEEIKLTHKDLLVFYYLSSFAEDLIDITIEEIAKDCKVSTATAYRAIKKLEKARKIKVYKNRNNRNVYKIIDNKYKKELQYTKNIKKEQKKYENKIDKNTEIFVSETDFKKCKRNEKLDAQTRYKLYLYRQKYATELQNTKLYRLTRDDLLFFLVNTEKLVENQSLSLQRLIKIIRYADLNNSIINPIGWLIERFMISRGRFYFLLSKSKKQKVEKKPSKNNYSVNQEKQVNPETRDVYISADLAYFAKKYNIPEDEILSYLSKFKYIDGQDVSYIVERYLVHKIYKNLPREEKQKLIRYAKRRIRNFAVPPSTEEEFKEHVKSIIAAKIKDDYLSLSIEERLQLKSSGQYDTS